MHGNKIDALTDLGPVVRVLGDLYSGVFAGMTNLEELWLSVRLQVMHVYVPRSRHVTSIVHGLCGTLFDLARWLARAFGLWAGQRLLRSRPHTDAAHLASVTRVVSLQEPKPRGGHRGLHRAA